MVPFGSLRLFRLGVHIKEGKYPGEGISYHWIVHFSVKAVAPAFHCNQLMLNIVTGEFLSHKN